MSRVVKVLSAKVPVEEYDLLLAEAEGGGKSISDYLRQVVNDRHKYGQLVADLEAIIAGSNAELSESISVTIRQELRQYKEELKSHHEAVKGFQELTTTTLEAQNKTLDMVRQLAVNNGKGLSQLLGLKGGN